MASDTITLPRQAPPAAWPEPPSTEPPAAAVATTQMAVDGSETTAAPSGAVQVVPHTPEQPPDLDLLGDRIAELSARIQGATYELLCYLREFDRRHGWEGFRSCAYWLHWLNWRTGLNLGAAREKLRVAAALADLNHLSAAMACGRLYTLRASRIEAWACWYTSSIRHRRCWRDERSESTYWAR